MMWCWFRGAKGMCLALLLTCANGCGVADGQIVRLDQLGRPVEVARTAGLPFGYRVREVFRYRYDDRGFLLETRTYGPHGQDLGRQTFEYGPDDQLLASRVYDDHGRLLRAIEYTPEEAAQFQAARLQFEEQCRAIAPRNRAVHGPGNTSGGASISDR